MGKQSAPETGLSAIVKEAEQEAGEAKWCLEKVQALEIATAADFELAATLVKGARANWKRLEARRTAITQPMMAAKRNVDDLFKPGLDALKAIQEVLEVKIGAYTRAQQAAQESAMLASAAAFQAGGAPTDPIPEVPHAKGVSVKTVWTFKVTNPAEVPREYCSPDPDKIRAAIWYADTPRTPPRPIPGIEFELVTDVTVRADRVKNG